MLIGRTRWDEQGLLRGFSRPRPWETICAAPARRQPTQSPQNPSSRVSFVFPNLTFPCASSLHTHATQPLVRFGGGSAVLRELRVGSRAPPRCNALIHLPSIQFLLVSVRCNNWHLRAHARVVAVPKMEVEYWSDDFGCWFPVSQTRHSP